MVWRIVHNLTFPYGGSGINGHISYVAFAWASLDDLLALVTRGGWLARIDVQEYYRQFAICPEDYHLLALRWDFGDGAGEIELWDAFMPFGLTNAVEYAHRSTMGAVRVLGRRGHSNLVGVMDDLGIADPTREGCSRSFAATLGLLDELGLPPNLKPTKTHDAAQLMNFVGVEVDSVAMEARLGPEKLAKTLAGVRRLLALEGTGVPASAQEVESLVGLLSWVARLVYGGRTFISGLLASLRDGGGRRRVVGPGNRVGAAPPVQLSAGCFDDLHWWAAFLPTFNGKCKILDWSGWTPRLFSTDADLDTGIGVFVDGGYVGLTFAQAAAACPQFSPLRPGPADPIHTKEIYAVLVAITLFSDVFCGCAITLRSDNTVAVAGVNKGASGAVDPRVMEYLREIFWASARYNFRIQAVYIPTGVNGLADALSRQQWPRFYGLLRDWRLRVARDGHGASIESALGA